MNKLLSWALAGVAALAAAVPVAQAATQAGSFNVTVTLTAVCTNTTVGTPSVDFGTYTAFGTASTPAPTATMTFKCTRGLTAPKMDLDVTANGTNTQQGTVGTTAATGNGVLTDVGINYGLSIAGAITTTGVAPTTAAGNTGTADMYTFTITGSMPANQAGKCTTGSCASSPTAGNGGVRTLTITY
ncbi:MAG TPA: hypothetical protein PLI90_03270 [Rhodocyclaceae bacterium]|nr:hypothetical protein [Rhodocyclaceae bacterium]